MFKKISDIDVDRRREESSLRSDIHKCLDKFEDYKFIFNQHDKHMRNINENINLISQQQHDFKDYVDNENKRLMEFISKINQGFMDDLGDVRNEIKELHKQLNKNIVAIKTTNLRQADEIEKLKEVAEQVVEA